jgi:hypothetical protein
VRALAGARWGGVAMDGLLVQSENAHVGGEAAEAGRSLPQGGSLSCFLVVSCYWMGVQIQERRKEVAEAVRRVERATQALEEEKKWLEDAKVSRWFQDASESGPVGESRSSPHRRIRLNIGGQLFETTARVLASDPDSALAKLAGSPPPADGAWFFDRDWWTFRFVLQYLREGEASLPRSKPLLKALYAESRFFGLRSLREAVRLVYQRIAAAEAEADGRAAVAAGRGLLVDGTIA